MEWNIGIEGILENLKSKCKWPIQLPMLDKQGIEYLGKNYSLKEVVI
jgi:hypothetical protein